MNGSQTRATIFLLVGLVSAPSVIAAVRCWGQIQSVLCCPAAAPRTCVSNQPGNVTTWCCDNIVNKPGTAVANVKSPPLPGTNGHRDYVTINTGDCLTLIRSCAIIPQPDPPLVPGCVDGDEVPSPCLARYEDTANSLPCAGPPAPPADPELPQ